MPRTGALQFLRFISLATVGTISVSACGPSGSDAPNLEVVKNEEPHLTKIAVTSHDPKPVTIQRVVFNGREGVPDCDLSAKSPPHDRTNNADLPATLEATDAVLFSYFANVELGELDKCGYPILKIDVYTNRGVIQQTWDY